MIRERPLFHQGLAVRDGDSAAARMGIMPISWPTVDEIMAFDRACGRLAAMTRILSGRVGYYGLEHAEQETLDEREARQAREREAYRRGRANRDARRSEARRAQRE